MRKNKRKSKGNNERVSIYDTNKNGKTYYRIEWNIDGKRFFEGCGTDKLKAITRRDEKEAELETKITYALSDKSIYLAKQIAEISEKKNIPVSSLINRLGYELSDDGILFAKNMMILSKEIGSSLAKITKFILNNKGRLSEVLTPCTLDAAISEFILSRQRKQCRLSTIKYYRDYLGHFMKRFGGDTQINELEHLFEEYFMGLVSKIHAKRVFLCFFKFCLNAKYISCNWMEPIKLEKILTDKTVPVIVTPEQARAILYNVARACRHEIA